jgi:hypothetical protein
MSLTTGITTNSTDIGEIFVQVNSSANKFENFNALSSSTGGSGGWINTGSSIILNTPGYYLITFFNCTNSTGDANINYYSFGFSLYNVTTIVASDVSDVILSTGLFTQGYSTDDGGTEYTNTYSGPIYSQTMLFNNTAVNSEYFIFWTKFAYGFPISEFTVYFNISAVYIGPNINNQ